MRFEQQCGTDHQGLQPARSVCACELLVLVPAEEPSPDWQGTGFILQQPCASSCERYVSVNCILPCADMAFGFNCMSHQGSVPYLLILEGNFILCEVKSHLITLCHVTLMYYPDAQGTLWRPRLTS